ncbi:MAG: lasso RiPP family leader peptide-containing protein [Candidatus Poribacteria bacterium]|nr:lasso RiPP family leader peptide-containing protein [Candidatus Poribacteria bacterium]
MTDVKFAGDAKPVLQELETYEKPTLVELGSILALTAGLGTKDDDGCYEGHNNL